MILRYFFWLPLIHDSAIIVALDGLFDKIQKYVIISINMKHPYTLRSARIAGGSVAFGLLTAILLGVAHSGSLSFAARPLAVANVEERRIIVQQMSNALSHRSALLKRETTVHLSTTDGSVLTPWKVALVRHPSWMLLDIRSSAVMISAQRVAESLTTNPPEALPSPVDCKLLAIVPDGKVTRAQTTCIASGGYEYDRQALAQALTQALESGESEFSFTVTKRDGRIVDAGADGVGDLQLITAGKSNFKGSGEGRKFNVRKAFDEKVHNVFVPAGATFAFNDVLGGAVTIKSGWKMAYAIFDGGTLVNVPGGGICQASTTVYRAALKAGFPIVQYKNHSLYVTYYEAYGVGQDATVFPGQQNLTFLNDSGGPLLLQAYHSGDDAFVNIYGRPDGRTVKLEGPYFTKTAPADVLVNDKRALYKNEIAWVRKVTGTDGVERREMMLSRYKILPKNLAAKWPAQTETIIHGAAAEVSMAGE